MLCLGFSLFADGDLVTDLNGNGWDLFSFEEKKGYAFGWLSCSSTIVDWLMYENDELGEHYKAYTKMFYYGGTNILTLVEDVDAYYNRRDLNGEYINRKYYVADTILFIHQKDYWNWEESVFTLYKEEPATEGI